jgi:hypothetical protein
MDSAQENNADFLPDSMGGDEGQNVSGCVSAYHHLPMVFASELRCVEFVAPVTKVPAISSPSSTSKSR